MIFNIYNFRTMTTKTTQTVVKRRHCRSVLLGVAVLATFALFAACERPEPEPEPPSAPAVDTDTLPANKFVGTWVLCGTSSANENVPCDCVEDSNTIDTLIFMGNGNFIHKHGNKTFEYLFDASETFLLYDFNFESHYRPYFVKYSFRLNGQELVLNGNFRNIEGDSLCFIKISPGTQTTEPLTYQKLGGTWISRCWAEENVEPDCECESPWYGDTLTFSGNIMLFKDNAGVVQDFFFENTATHLIFYKPGVWGVSIKPINVQDINTTMTIYKWQSIDFSIIEKPYYNVCFKKLPNE